MGESCDRCGPEVGAAYRVAAKAGELFFCGHCSQALWLVLVAAGWMFFPLGVAAAPQTAHRLSP